MDKYKILKKYFGYDSFREGQSTLIDGILDNKDVLGIMPTGAGKSLCYQIPALMLEGITLVISPLISLMNDQVRALNEAGLHAAYINSSLTDTQLKKALIFASQGKYKIIYVAPERLLTNGFINFAKNSLISMVTIDESHCISQWGQDFRPSYLKIVEFIDLLDNRPIVSAFTATATTKVKEDIISILQLNKPKVLVNGFDRENLFFGVEKPKSKSTFIEDYMNNHKNESGIIYCATRKNVDTLYEKLKRDNLPVTRYHAGLSITERNKNQEDFIYDNSPIMIATNAFGMGIDKSNVRYVIHYNMPQSMENYYQEAGRAGRDNEKANCILLYSPQDLMINHFLIDSKEENTDLSYEEAMNIKMKDEERLQIMNSYCLTKDCLRTYILNYFGEEDLKDCSNCGNCLKEYISIDITKEAKIIIDALNECNSRYGINVIANSLKGSTMAKLKDYHMERYKLFGMLNNYSADYIKKIISELIIDGYIETTKDKYALLKLNEKSYSLCDESIFMKIEKELPKDNTKVKTSKKTLKDIDLSEEDSILFEKLRVLRSEISKNEKIPPYLVFSDKTLKDMCLKKPKNNEEMLLVNGVGENKLNKYGEQFINIFM